jgi:hypothetical protein
MSPHTTNATLKIAALGPTPRPLIGLLMAPETPPSTPYGVMVAGCSRPSTIQASSKRSGPATAPSANQRVADAPAGCTAVAVACCALPLI